MLTETLTEQLFTEARGARMACRDGRSLNLDALMNEAMDLRWTNLCCKFTAIVLKTDSGRWLGQGTIPLP